MKTIYVELSKDQVVEFKYNIDTDIYVKDVRMPKSDGHIIYGKAKILKDNTNKFDQDLRFALDSDKFVHDWTNEDGKSIRYSVYFEEVFQILYQQKKIKLK